MGTRSFCRLVWLYGLAAKSRVGRTRSREGQRCLTIRSSGPLRRVALLSCGGQQRPLNSSVRGQGKCASSFFGLGAWPYIARRPFRRRCLNRLLRATLVHSARLLGKHSGSFIAVTTRPRLLWCPALATRLHHSIFRSHSRAPPITFAARALAPSRRRTPPTPTLARFQPRPSVASSSKLSMWASSCALPLTIRSSGPLRWAAVLSCGTRQRPLNSSVRCLVCPAIYRSA